MYLRLRGIAPALSPTRPPTGSYALGGRVGERAGPSQSDKNYFALRRAAVRQRYSTASVAAARLVISPTS